MVDLLVNGSQQKVSCPNCGHVSGGAGPAARHLQRCPSTPEELATMVGADSSDPDACWVPTTNKERARVRGDRAHRVAAQLALGPIPKGKVVCHTCDVDRCCNPRHLWYGTQKDNIHDMMAKGRGRGQFQPGNYPARWLNRETV